MRFTGTIDAEHQVTLPDEIVTELHLQPGSQVIMDVSEVISTSDKLERSKRFKQALDKYRGSMREQMLADGYVSVDEMMADIRPEW